MRLSTAALVLSATFLAGCGGTQNRSVNSVHQPVVSRADYTLDLSAGPGGLATGEQQRLAGWLAALGTRYGDRLTVDDGGNGDTATRGDIAAVAGRYGLLLGDSAPVTPGAVEPGIVRVVVSRMSAAVPGCPDQSRTYQPNFGAHTSSDFGCGINRNLAAMIAQPEDLVRGRSTDGVTDPMTASKPIDALRKSPTAVGQALQATRTSNSGAQ
ncbi:CpaD family pilus assembly protein [Sphingomonas spermidinifaciens]|nr:CpaD family pilus assembly protein [Sphingomonas spermidinifaciens]